jgi:biopolymer transport protein ExbD
VETGRYDKRYTISIQEVHQQTRKPTSVEMGRRKKKHAEGDVELNLAAMLDMAFQLLTFFILTFKPSPVEGEIELRLPPAQPTTLVKGGQAAGSDVNNTNPVKGLDSLIISVMASRPSGSISGIMLGETNIGGVAGLKTRLGQVLGDRNSPFEQVLVNVDPALRYDALMQVIDVCTNQKLPDGKKLTRLSFVQMGQ